MVLDGGKPCSVDALAGLINAGAYKQIHRVNTWGGSSTTVLHPPMFVSPCWQGGEQERLTRYAMQTRALKISGLDSGDTLDRTSCINKALVPRKELVNCIAKSHCYCRNL